MLLQWLATGNGKGNLCCLPNGVVGKLHVGQVDSVQPTEWTGLKEILNDIVEK